MMRQRNIFGLRENHSGNFWSPRVFTQPGPEAEISHLMLPLTMMGGKRKKCVKPPHRQ